MNKLKAILFDKDGTLLDHDLTWAGYIYEFIRLLTPLDHDQRRIGEAIGFLMESKTFVPGSVVVNGTIDDVYGVIKGEMPDFTDIRGAEIDREAMKAQRVTEITPIAPLIDALNARGFLTAIITNDVISSTTRQLDALGVHSMFDSVLCADSGFTPKPAGDMILGFCTEFDLEPSEVAMVGDSTHDLNAGRNAQVGLNIGVLTGPADRANLSMLSDLVLPSVADLLSYLDG